MAGTNIKKVSFCSKNTKLFFYVIALRWALFVSIQNKSPSLLPFFSRGEHALRHAFLHSSLLEVRSRKKKWRR